MTLKEIKNKYLVIKRDGSFYLHSNEISGRTVHKYLCTLIKHNQRTFSVDGYEPVTKVNLLENQVNDYLDKLEYDSEYYSPIYRKGTAQDWFTLDLLREYGFERERYSDLFKYSVKSIYNFPITQISLGYKIDREKEIVMITIYTNNGWIPTECGFDLKEIHKTLDGLLKPLFLGEAVNSIKTSDKMENTSLDIILAELKGFDATKTKVDLKNKLLELANTL